MTKHAQVLLPLLACLVAVSLGMRYNPDWTRDYALKYGKKRNIPRMEGYRYIYKWDDAKKRYTNTGVDCSHFAGVCFQAGLGGPFATAKRLSDEEIKQGHTNEPHKNSKYDFGENGTLPWAADMRDFLVDEFDCPEAKWSYPNTPSVDGVRSRLPNVRAGDFACWYNGSGVRHIMIIVDVSDTEITYAGHSSDRINGKFLKTTRDNGYNLQIVHVPDVVPAAGLLGSFADLVPHTTTTPTAHLCLSGFRAGGSSAAGMRTWGASLLGSAIRRPTRVSTGKSAEEGLGTP